LDGLSGVGAKRAWDYVPFWISGPLGLWDYIADNKKIIPKENIIKQGSTEQAVSTCTEKTKSGTATMKIPERGKHDANVERRTILIRKKMGKNRISNKREANRAQ